MSRPAAFWWLWFLAILPVSWSSAEPLVVGDAERSSLGGHLELLQDDTGGKTLAQVMGAAGWRRTDDAEPNVGFSTAVYWARFQVQSQADHPLLLVYQFANVDNVDAFVVHADGSQVHMASGSRVPFFQRAVAHRFPLFPLGLAKGETAWCYVQLKNASALFPMAVWSETAFRAMDHDLQFVLGIFGGLFFVVVLFNALFYFGTRDRAYLYYVVFVLSYLLFEVAFRGLAGEYLWPRNTWIDDSVELTASSVAVTFGLLFAISFLQTRVFAPVMHRILQVMAVSAAVNTVSTFFVPFDISVEITDLFLLLTALVLAVNALIVLRRGYRAARFYFAAWLLILPGGFVFGLFNLGLIPGTQLTINSLSFGASTEMVVLFFAIVDRILLLRRESQTLQKERLDAVQKRLYSDTLTELPNRNRLLSDLSQGRTVTIAIVNIDHFKEINDYFGQKAGDHVIKELGNRILAAATGRGGAVYRLHADEIAVVVSASYDDAQLDDWGRTLTSRCQDQPYVYENETLRLDVSIGIAVTNSRHLEKVDMALAVARTRKTFVTYRPELEVIKRYADNLHWLHVLREAVEQDRIIPYFQPILNNATGTIDKFESLMRIRATDGQIIPPGAFFTLAKKSKMYPLLSQAIIRKTAGMMRGAERKVSINVSLEDITHPDVLDVIERVASEDGLGERLVLELLESEGIENYGEVSQFIERMKKYGCTIAIDDFGSGYSNFEHILRLRVDFLKLDSSLIKPIAEDANARSIVETIVSFARKLGIQTIAEYVHNEAVQSVVRSIGVDHSQGYFISPPRPDMDFQLQFTPA